MPVVLMAPSDYGHRSPARPAGKMKERQRKDAVRCRRTEKRKGKNVPVKK